MALDQIKLSDRLNNYISKYNQAYEDWRIYIQDHKQLILDNSTKVIITPEDMEQYLFRPELYLKENHNIKDPKYIWIFMFINELVSDMDFNQLNTNVRIPDTSYIDKLLSIFKAVIAAGIKR